MQYYRSNNAEVINRPTQRAPDPRKNTETMVVGVCAFSGSLCSLELVPAKWRCLVPGERRDGAQSHPPAGNAHR
jgi:hypothetical protein